MSALDFEAVIRDTQFGAQINRIERQIQGLTTTAVQESKKVDTTFRDLGRLVAGYFTFNALSQLPAELIRIRGEVQQTEIALLLITQTSAACNLSQETRQAHTAY